MRYYTVIIFHYYMVSVQEFGNHNMWKSASKSRGNVGKCNSAWKVITMRRNLSVLSVQHYLQEGTEATWWESADDVIWRCTSVSRYSAFHEHLLLLSCWPRLWTDWNLWSWHCSGRYAELLPFQIFSASVWILDRLHRNMPLCFDIVSWHDVEL